MMVVWSHLVRGRDRRHEARAARRHIALIVALTRRRARRLIRDTVAARLQLRKPATKARSDKSRYKKETVRKSKLKTCMFFEIKQIQSEIKNAARCIPETARARDDDTGAIQRGVARGGLGRGGHARGEEGRRPRAQVAGADDGAGRAHVAVRLPAGKERRQQLLRCRGCDHTIRRKKE